MEINLEILIKNMSPTLNIGSYVFCSVNRSFVVPDSIILASFMEQEGKTLVLSRESAENHKLEYSSVMAWITLNVHSSLQAVGFTAKISTALAENEISCNVIAGYYHDHLFVEKDDAEKAMQVLNDLSMTNSG
ncbi:ACT domain-containing protein [Reichenbachiella sp. MALMAid0571]|uniref:ACT domain-containing protein n=1 Tax=Reichenbachiella sp. MALMAid0571 TaxID=3143939 RepID=UPI0032DEE991